jgi:oxygen-independent coproporphyrinogen-3 oxidase
VAGIYIHIPFCKQACHYCDFHFSTSVKKKHELVQSLCRELELRKSELTETVETIYFGGGTPSLLTAEELDLLLECVDTNYSIIDSPEITLEANPDDLTPEKIRELSDSKVNRLSIGIQSFFEEDLKMMNRAHNVKEALECIKNAIPHFKNISVDLIYGIPGMTRDRWLENIRTAISLGVPHLSCYALTIEPKTALDNFIKKGLMAPMDDALAQEHYTILIEETEKMGFINYEFSNFGKEGYQSQNNMAYWRGKSYLGIGPSAHSYDGTVRSWNVNNNTKYIKSIEKNQLPIEREVLSEKDKYNEYIMTRLRTQWGVSLREVDENFGRDYRKYLMTQAQRSIENELLSLENNILTITKKGKFLCDGIAADLFLVNLEF